MSVRGLGELIPDRVSPEMAVLNLLHHTFRERYGAIRIRRERTLLKRKLIASNYLDKNSRGNQQRHRQLAQHLRNRRVFFLEDEFIRGYCIAQFRCGQPGREAQPRGTPG